MQYNATRWYWGRYQEMGDSIQTRFQVGWRLQRLRIEVSWSFLLPDPANMPMVNSFPRKKYNLPGPLLWVERNHWTLQHRVRFSLCSGVWHHVCDHSDHQLHSLAGAANGELGKCFTKGFWMLGCLDVHPLKNWCKSNRFDRSSPIPKWIQNHCVNQLLVSGISLTLGVSPGFAEGYCWPFSERSPG